ncbi:hypothetical protein VULLAG_LOCUS206 [Vulpes lagopus]
MHLHRIVTPRPAISEVPGKGKVDLYGGEIYTAFARPHFTADLTSSRQALRDTGTRCHHGLCTDFYYVR